MRWQARISVRQVSDGAGEPGEFGDVGDGTVLQEQLEPSLGVGVAGGGVHVSEELAGGDRGGEFAVGPPAVSASRRRWIIALVRVDGSRGCDRPGAGQPCGAVQRCDAGVRCHLRRETRDPRMAAGRSLANSSTS